MKRRIFAAAVLGGGIAAGLLGAGTAFADDAAPADSGALIDGGLGNGDSLLGGDFANGNSLVGHDLFGGDGPLGGDLIGGDLIGGNLGL